MSDNVPNWPIPLPIPSEDEPGNPCPDGWREVQPGERVADVSMMIGAVVGGLRRDGIEVELSRFLDDDNHVAMVAAMTEFLGLLGVPAAEMKYEWYEVA